MIFQKSNPILTVSFEEFKNGLWTSLPLAGIPLGAASISKNVDYSRANGRIPKRAGIQSFTSNGAGSLSNIYQFLLSPAGGGTKFDMAANSSNILSIVSNVWTSRYAAFGGAGTLQSPNWTTFSDLNIMVSVSEPTEKWDGVAGGYVALLGTPPANGKFICVWQNRVWIANTSAGASRLHYSNAGLPEDWTTPAAAGFIDVNQNDGDVITGIMPLGNYLYVFKNRTVHQVSGISPGTFAVIPFITSRGCVAPKSIVNMGQYIVYLSQYGIHSVGQYVDGFMSEAIRYDIQNLPNKGISCAGKVRDLYVLGYDSTGGGTVDSAYVLDNRTGSWTQYGNIKANAFFQRDDGALYSAANDSQKIRKHDSGEDDEGVAIPMQWRSGMMGYDDFTAMKNLYDVWWDAKPLAGKTLTTNTIVDGIQVDSNTQPLDAFGGQGIKSFGLDNVPAAYGRFVQLEFVNSELAAPVEINQFSTAAIVTPRQQLPS